MVMPSDRTGELLEAAGVVVGMSLILCQALLIGLLMVFTAVFQTQGKGNEIQANVTGAGCSSAAGVRADCN